MSVAVAAPIDLIELKPADEKRARQRPRPKPEAEPRDTGPHRFPLATAVRDLPPMIPDEILDFCGFVFCQGGFRQRKIPGDARSSTQSRPRSRSAA